MWFPGLEQFLCKHEYHFCITDKPKFTITKAECIYCGKTIKGEEQIKKLLKKLKV